MNRNTNAHFAELPKVDISRSIMDRSHKLVTSGNVGDVIPIYVDPDIMPGDTVTMDTSKVIRFQTMLSPVMDNMYCDIYWFFIPHRLIHDHFVNIMGENTESAWAPQTEYTTPKIKVPSPSATNTNNYVGSILDYMKFPVGMAYASDEFVEICAYPVRAYAKVMQDWFISENLSDPLNLYTGDNAVTANTANKTYIDDVPAGGHPFKAAKFADYYTSCLPSPQKGDAVELELSSKGLTQPVYSGDIDNYDPEFILPWLSTWPDPSRTIYKSGDNNKFSKIIQTNTSITGSSQQSNFYSIASDGNGLTPVNLFTPAPNGLFFTVNDLRYAFQLQKLLERDARSGSRYIETIRAHFGVISSDARLQRSEYLGGNRFGINIDQVANTAQTENDFLGDLGAFSVTGDIHSDFTFSAQEHGSLLGVMVLRYDHTYCQGIPKYFLRDDRFSFYWPVFANIGEQPVYKKEIFLSGSATDDETFGYNEAWAEYRFQPNAVTGELRPYVNNGLYSWTYADDYNSAPSLSDSWLREDKTNVDRTLAVTSAVSNQFWADIYFSTKYTRPMPVYSVPGLIDHN